MFLIGILQLSSGCLVCVRFPAVRQCFFVPNGSFADKHFLFVWGGSSARKHCLLVCGGPSTVRC